MWLKARRRNNSGGSFALHSAEVIRAEIFSSERLDQHATSLAAAQTVTTRPATVPALTKRLDDNHRALLDAHHAIAKAITQQSAITPAAEWLVDNFHVVEAQIRQIRDDLPPGYYRQLPKLATGPLTGYPRVLELAWAFVAHTDSRFDTHLLTSFVGAYQREQPLTIGELWAIAITLRIVLVENLRRAADLITSARTIRQQADRLADRLLGAGGHQSEPFAMLSQEWDGVELSTTFAVQLLQRLRDHDPEATPALTWLEARLAAAGMTADAVVHDEHQRQGASSVTVRNVIMSMRSISAVDWADLFEVMSLVDSVLRADPGFEKATFPTRNRYREAIEELSRGSRHSELDLAHRVIQVASAGTTPGERDCGSPLIGAGRKSFEAAVGYRPAMRVWPARVTAAVGIFGYISIIGLLAMILIAWPLCELLGMRTGDWQVVVLMASGFVLSLEAAMALVNNSITSRFGAKPLPELELRNGIGADMRTLVVVPVMLTTPEAIAAQLKRLEIHHLASLDGDISFALLSDWTDSPCAHGAGDDALLASAATGISYLNRQYGPAPAGERFLLLHRQRTWRVSLRHYRNESRRFMTIRTGLYFLWAGLGLLAVSGIGAVLSGHVI